MTDLEFVIKTIKTHVDRKEMGYKEDPISLETHHELLLCLRNIQDEHETALAESFEAGRDAKNT